MEKEEYRFDSQELLDEISQKYLQEWVDNNEMVGLIDEEKGGIIGYINRAHIEEICELLNKNQQIK